ncbi:MAG TPA: branched-chain amino acid ABC transporter substrate-binding protein [Anaerolineales bacterium]
MKIKAFILLLVISASACSVLSGPAGAPSPSAAFVVPTFYLVQPSPTGLPPTQALPTFDVHLPSPTPFPLTATPTLIPTATQNPAWPVATLEIVSSLPKSGPTASIALSLVRAERLRLEQSHLQACGGKYGLALDDWTDAFTQPARYDPTLESANAYQATRTASVIAYVGAFTSDAAKLVIPILDQAGPLLLLSPTSSYAGLTKAVLRQPGEPDKYYPAGVRNFARVISTDDLQGTVSAGFLAKVLGIKTVFILDDEELYGQTVSDAFESTATLLGVKVLGHEAIKPRAESYQTLMWRIAASNNGHPPDAIFASVLSPNDASQLLQDKVSVIGDNTKVRFMGSAATYAQSFIEGAGPLTAEGAYVAAPGLPFPNGLTDAGKQFVQDYQAAYSQLADPSAIYAYESVNVLLKAIENICAAGGDPTNRRQVRDAVFNIHKFDGVLGTWAFDQNGDTTLTDMTVYQVQNGIFQVIATSK